MAVLVADDDAAMAAALARDLGAGAKPESAESAEAALAELQRRPFSVLVAGVGGLGFVRSALAQCPDLRIVVVSAEGGAAAAVEAMRNGAFDCVERRAGPAGLLRAVQAALASTAAEEDEPPPPPASSVGILGKSRAMDHVHDLVRRAAPGDATILIRGESGTGKELVARSVHECSGRAAGPLVKVHCAALPDALLESELFGYEKGAFTGAAARKQGRVELAEGGTLFLDEIGDITPAVQVKLLRVLQDRRYERLGGTETLAADVRFVAATHRDLDAMVKKGEFREDLFYRLNVVAIWLPPLRARREDIDLLARGFAEMSSASGGKSVTLTDDALAVLRSERWPGNVRQLQNFVERLVVLAEGPTIDASDVRRELTGHVAFATQSTLGPKSRGPASLREVVPLSQELRRAERHAIERALAHTKGNRTVAARILGISRATLYNKLTEHSIG